jgi:hypothetical protein|tara:strand:- start:3788 stop:3901 length:114 start_codon:yes stop_codon:yes gene_type:complete
MQRDKFSPVVIGSIAISHGLFPNKKGPLFKLSDIFAA